MIYMISKLLIFGMFLGVISHSLDVDFTQSYYGHFKTDIDFHSQYKIILLSGKVPGSVDPNDIKNNDLICPGSRLRLIPNKEITWANNFLDITSVYHATPPPGIPGTSIRQTGKLKFITLTEYNTLRIFDEDWKEPTTRENYAILEPYIPQPAHYYGCGVGTPCHYDSTGGAVVACSGGYIVNDNGNIISSNDLKSLSNIDFSLNTPGAHQIISELNNLNCMAALQLYPKQNFVGGNPFYHQVWYYKNGVNPYSISNKFSSSILLNVQDGGGTCLTEQISLNKDSKNIMGNEYSLVTLKVKNSGTATTLIKDVLDYSNTFEIYKSDDSVCMNFGMCSPSIIGSLLNPGESKNLLFYTKRLKIGNGNFYLNTTIKDNGCSDGSCFIHFDLSDYGYSCKINPESISLNQGNIYNFKADCFENGTAISCFGDWTTSGNVRSKNTNSINVSFDSSTTLNYNLGESTCSSEVKVNSNNEKSKCVINGPLGFYTGMSAKYNIECFDETNKVKCESINWLGNIQYKERNLENATIQGSKIGTYTIEAETLINGNKITCNKNIDIWRNKCVYYS